MELEDVFTLVIAIGLAVVAIRNIFKYETKKGRIAYITGLISGAGLGLGVAAENGSGYTLGLAIGLGASVAGGYAVEWFSKRAGNPSPTPVPSQDRDDRDDTP